MPQSWWTGRNLGNTEKEMHRRWKREAQTKGMGDRSPGAGAAAVAGVQKKSWDRRALDGSNGEKWNCEQEEEEAGQSECWAPLELTARSLFPVRAGTQLPLCHLHHFQPWVQIPIHHQRSSLPSSPSTAQVLAEESHHHRPALTPPILVWYLHQSLPLPTTLLLVKKKKNHSTYHDLKLLNLFTSMVIAWLSQ